MGLLVCVALSLYQRETATFSPPQRLYRTIDPNSSAGPEALLEAQARLVAEMRSEALALVKHLMTIFPRDENADIFQGDDPEDRLHFWRSEDYLSNRRFVHE